MLPPDIAPVLVPNVHEKLLATLAVNARPGLKPLQITDVVALVMDGIGFIDTGVEPVIVAKQPEVEFVANTV